MSDDPFVRAMRWIGDASNPFYAEERQRDVWNEAAAFGFQLMIFTALLAGSITVWTVGGPAVWYLQGALVLVGLVSAVTVGYARRLGVPVFVRTTPKPSRTALLVGLVLVYVLGIIRANSADWSASTLAGMLFGASIVSVPLWLLVRSQRRREKSDATG